MILQVGDDGVVSEVNEDDLIYVDKNELDAFVEEYNHLKEEKEQQQKSFDELAHNWKIMYNEAKEVISNLEKENIRLSSDLDYYCAKSKSCEEGLFQQDRKISKLQKENKDLREQLILANAFIKMIENCYEDANIEDILYMKYGEFQEELHLQMAIAKEELEK